MARSIAESDCLHQYEEFFRPFQEIADKYYFSPFFAGLTQESSV